MVDMYYIYVFRFQQNVLLQKINLSWNGFSKDGAMALGDALKVNTSLEELDVS